ncbi:hypothetical protein EYF80_062383 [Liparis tanakae]|uniref:Uncharacterized protein n=1 Tax=Liparis tanakae TaxID=230148 RepID=A0A4Z2EFE1_9TELE|nr:hypothetical protein EYF80_062383 [Liparis tanakae]
MKFQLDVGVERKDGEMEMEILFLHRKLTPSFNVFSRLRKDSGPQTASEYTCRGVPTAAGGGAYTRYER